MYNGWVGAGRLGIGGLAKLGAVCTSEVTFGSGGTVAVGAYCKIRSCDVVSNAAKQAPTEAGGRLAGTPLRQVLQQAASPQTSTDIISSCRSF